MQEIEQFAGDRVGRFGEGDETIDGFRKLGGAPIAVPHLAGDEARIDRAGPHDARQSGGEGSGAWTLRIGHVEHHKIGGAAEHFCRRGKAANKGHVLGAFQQVAAGIVAWMHEKIGAGDALCERTRDIAAVASSATITVRRRRKIRGADGFGAGVAAEQVLDAGAVGARRGAEDAIKPCRAARAPCARQRIFIVSFVAGGDRLHCGIDERNLRREKIAE